MREIKFRAWIIAEKRMIYQPAILEHSIREYDWSSVCVGYKAGTDPDDYERKTIPCIITLNEYGRGLVVLQQYTGLKDKNGKEIYEGDILSGVSGRFGENRNYVVEIPDIYGTYNETGTVFDEDVEVLSNIYEHGELLK